MGESGQEKKKILIIDDSEVNRSILKDMLGGGYEILEACDGVEGVEILRKYEDQIDLVLLDIIMPNMDGFGVLSAMNEKRWIEYIPVVMISTERDPVYIEKAYEMGITDFIARPCDTLILRRRVINTIMLYAKQKKLISLVADQVYEKEKTSNLMVSILSHIVEFRNGESGLHVLHIRTITGLLLKSLVKKSNKYSLTRSDVSLISTASALHDIGKIGIPEAILNKPGRLTREEFEIMKTHSMLGATMLSGLPFYQNEKLIRLAYEICRWHHERYDGKGYPDGLKGDEIPIAAQIVALADVYDALTSKRVYKDAYSHEKAIQMILDGECGVFNPLLLECLTEIQEQLKEELEQSSFSKSSQREMQKIAEELMAHAELSLSKRTLNLLEHERIKYQFLASMTNDILFEYTNTPSMITFSEQGAKRLGIRETMLNPYQNRNVLHTFGTENLQGFGKLVKRATPEQPIFQYDCRITIDDELKWARLVCCTTWSGDEPPQYTGLIGKIVELKDEENVVVDIDKMITRDPLTGLLNFTHARLRIREQLELRRNSEFAIVIFDLDSFRSANDRYGHIFGDNLLKYMAERLRQCIRSEDIAARIGGDEFLVMVEYKKEKEKVIERIYNDLTGEHDGFPVSVAMGIARTEDIGRDCEALLRGAEQALSTIKLEKKKGYSFYDKTMRSMRPVLSSIEELENMEDEK
ncbi:MAG: diguanylate cyclase domain-containing protein [Acetivibrio ethanolgignens]